MAWHVKGECFRVYNPTTGTYSTDRHDPDAVPILPLLQRLRETPEAHHTRETLHGRILRHIVLLPAKAVRAVGKGQDRRPGASSCMSP